MCFETQPLTCDNRTSRASTRPHRESLYKSQNSDTLIRSRLKCLCALSGVRDLPDFVSLQRLHQMVSSLGISSPRSGCSSKVHLAYKIALLQKTDTPTNPNQPKPKKSGYRDPVMGTGCHIFVVVMVCSAATGAFFSVGRKSVYFWRQTFALPSCFVYTIAPSVELGLDWVPVAGDCYSGYSLNGSENMTQK